MKINGLVLRYGTKGRERSGMERTWAGCARRRRKIGRGSLSSAEGAHFAGNSRISGLPGGITGLTVGGRSQKGPTATQAVGGMLPPHGSETHYTNLERVQRPGELRMV